MRFALQAHLFYGCFYGKPHSVNRNSLKKMSLKNLIVKCITIDDSDLPMTVAIYD